MSNVPNKAKYFQLDAKGSEYRTLSFLDGHGVRRLIESGIQMVAVSAARCGAGAVRELIEFILTAHNLFDTKQAS